MCSISCQTGKGKCPYDFPKACFICYGVQEMQSKTFHICSIHFIPFGSMGWRLKHTSRACYLICCASLSLKLPKTTFGEAPNNLCHKIRCMCVSYLVLFLLSIHFYSEDWLIHKSMNCQLIPYQHNTSPDGSISFTEGEEYINQSAHYHRDLLHM